MRKVFSINKSVFKCPLIYLKLNLFEGLSDKLIVLCITYVN